MGMRSSMLKNLLLVGLLTACCTGFALSKGELLAKGIRCYKNKNFTEAVKWFRQAAEQGDAKAQYNLGWCYARGEGVEPDDFEAAKWYRKAAEQGHSKAQYNLGMCYFKGEGVPKDGEKVAYWFRKAAVQGHVKAQIKLGLCYEDGIGVYKD